MNGTPHGFFHCGRRARQGDPLSPLLFCLVEDVLNRGLMKLRHNGLLNYISSPRGTTAPSHMFYADDLIIFCRADKKCITNLLMENYSQVSGQIVSRKKVIYSWEDL